MEELKKLKETLEGITYQYDMVEYYNQVYNAIIDYENKTQDWSFEGYLNDVINYELAEQAAKQELDNGGLLRLYYFLGDANLNNEIFRIDGYGNLQDVEKEDIDVIIEDIIDEIDKLLEKGE